jgi:hypothetical protein
MVNYRTGEIEINPVASEHEQARAKLTIDFYGLNDHGRPQSRLLEYRKFRTLMAEGNYQLDDFSYRFFLV